MLGEHVGGRNHDGTNLTKGQHHNPPLVATLQDQHHGIALANAERLQIGCSLVALLFQLFIGGTYLLALVVSPEQCQFLGRFLGPCVHHVVSKVEVLGDDELQVLVVILH